MNPESFLPILAALVLVVIITSVCAVINCLKRTFASSREKILWILGIMMFQPWGAIVYYFVVVKSHPQGISVPTPKNTTSSDKAL